MLLCWYYQLPSYNLHSIIEPQSATSKGLCLSELNQTIDQKGVQWLSEKRILIDQVHSLVGNPLPNPQSRFHVQIYDTFYVLDHSHTWSKPPKLVIEISSNHSVVYKQTNKSTDIPTLRSIEELRKKEKNNDFMSFKPYITTVVLPVKA